MIISLCGPIEWWWGDRFETPEAISYRRWREDVAGVLVGSGHLVYRPYEAFKGEWDDNNGDALAQRVNEEAIRASHVVVDMTPTGVHSDGTFDELLLCNQLGIKVVHAPPPLRTDPPSAWTMLLELLLRRITSPWA